MQVNREGFGRKITKMYCLKKTNIRNNHRQNKGDKDNDE